MTIAAIDPVTRLAFSMFENRGVYALLLGSGLSRSAQIPTGWEITLDLTRRLAAAEGVLEQQDWAAWHVERFDEPPNYSRLLDRLAATPAERRAIIHGYIEPTDDDLETGARRPTRAHHAIARLVRDGFVRVLITTNFDRLLENALREAGVEPTVIKSEDDLAGAVPLIHTRCLVLKVHGDYLDTRILNIDSELEVYADAQSRYLDRIFDEHGLVVCGWSADWDPGLRKAIARAAFRRFPTFWTGRGTPSDLALDLIRQRGADLVPIKDADGFFEDLHARLETLSASARPHPLSTELVVGTAKRYLARDEHRILLADLVAGEAARAKDVITAREFTAQGQFTETEFAQRVSGYEAAYEPLCRVAFAMGRWGGENAFGLAQDLLQSLARNPVRNGLVVWLRLFEYPAALVFTAYALGVAKGGRLDLLHRWFKTPVAQARRDEEEPAVRRLFGEMWDGADRDIWNTLDPTQKRWTPFNDHLLTLFQAWTAPEFLDPAETELLFEWVELLAGAAMTMDGVNKTMLEATLQGRPGQRDYYWSAIGRAAWHSEHQERLLARLTREPTAQALLDAGFAQGDRDILDMLDQNFRRVMSNQRWR